MFELTLYLKGDVRPFCTFIRGLKCNQVLNWLISAQTWSKQLWNYQKEINMKFLKVVGGGQPYPKILDKQKRKKNFKILKILIPRVGGGGEVLYANCVGFGYKRVEQYLKQAWWSTNYSSDLKFCMFCFIFYLFIIYFFLIYIHYLFYLYYYNLFLNFWL